MIVKYPEFNRSLWATCIRKQSLELSTVRSAAQVHFQRQSEYHKPVGPEWRDLLVSEVRGTLDRLKTSTIASTVFGIWVRDHGGYEATPRQTRVLGHSVSHRQRRRRPPSSQQVHGASAHHCHRQRAARVPIVYFRASHDAACYRL